MKVTFDSDPAAAQPGSDAEYAARLLGRITAIPSGSLRRFATEEQFAVLLPTIRALRAQTRSRAARTTHEEEHGYALLLLALLDQFATRVSTDLERRVAVDLATTLLPRMTRPEGDGA